ncbi:YnhF family membrane protein [Vibrio sp. TH_r3]|uniref:cytochrome bd-I oxidase subunit CydH n=1 Tax=Vibrio sp. TH_r3 TaxID=3082084 RepID=UPI0039864B3E
MVQIIIGYSKSFLRLLTLCIVQLNLLALMERYFMEYNMKMALSIVSVSYAIILFCSFVAVTH